MVLYSPKLFSYTFICINLLIYYQLLIYCLSVFGDWFWVFSFFSYPLCVLMMWVLSCHVQLPLKDKLSLKFELNISPSYLSSIEIQIIFSPWPHLCFFSVMTKQRKRRGCFILGLFNIEQSLQFQLQLLLYATSLVNNIQAQICNLFKKTKHIFTTIWNDCLWTVFCQIPAVIWQLLLSPEMQIQQGEPT